MRVLPGLQPARTPADARGGKKGTIVSLPTVHLRPPPPQSKVKFGGSGSMCCEPATVHTTPPKLVCWQAQVCILPLLPGRRTSEYGNPAPMAGLLTRLCLLGTLACSSAYVATDASALQSGEDPASCLSISGTDAEDQWCRTGCVNSPPNCPSTICKCEGGMPSPSPVAGGAVGESAPEVADPREMTDVEKEAADAIKERDAAVAKADQEREEADKARAEAEEAKLKEDEERIKKAEADREAIEAAAKAAADSLKPDASPSPEPQHKIRSAGEAGSKYVSALVSGGDPKKCVAIGGALADNNWCATSCSNNPPNCPASICKCDSAAEEAAASPSPDASPLAEVRKMTKEEKAAQKEVNAKEGLVAAAEKARAKAEKEKLAAEEKRIADDEQRVANDEKERKKMEKAQRAAEPSPAPSKAKKSASTKATGSKSSKSSKSSKKSTASAGKTTIKDASALVAGTDPSTCKALENALVDNSWCANSCQASPPNCPANTCVCDGPNPSPSPVVVATPVIPDIPIPDIPVPPAPEPVAERKATPEQQAAQKAADDADAARSAADAEREAAEKTRMQEDAKRVADAEAARQAINPNTSADKEEDAKAPVAPEPSPLVAPEAPPVPDVPPVPELPKAPAVPAVPELTPVPAADARSATPEQQAAAAAQKERDDAVAAADAQREEAEKRRMQEDEARVAETEKMRNEGLEASKAAADAVASAADASSPVAPGEKIVAGLPQATALMAGADPASCTSKSGTVAETNWCKQGCSNNPPNCPAEVCECEGAVQQTAAVPSPSPLVTAADVEERPLTKEEKAAQKAIDERDAKVAEIDKQRAKEDAERAEQDAKRVADMYPGKEDAQAAQQQGEQQAVPTHSSLPEPPKVNDEGVAEARPLTADQQATQKALEDRDNALAAADEERKEAEEKKLEEEEKERLAAEKALRRAEIAAQPSPEPDADGED